MDVRAQEFQKCGDMVQFGNFGAFSRCNWIYIQYQVRKISDPARLCGACRQSLVASGRTCLSRKSRLGSSLRSLLPGGGRASSVTTCPLQNKWAAQRALQRDGEQLTPALMIGVKRLDPSNRAAIK